LIVKEKVRKKHLNTARNEGQKQRSETIADLGIFLEGDPRIPKGRGLNKGGRSTRPLGWIQQQQNYQDSKD